MYKQKSAIEITPEEAEALYSTGISNKCNYSYPYSKKKVWWAISQEDNLIFPFTICQECYHLNRFGYENASIKQDLRPFLICGTHCTCDGRKQDESNPINLGQGWLLGIYNDKNEIKLLNTKITYEKNSTVVDVEYPYENGCSIILNLTSNVQDNDDFYDYECVIEDPLATVFISCTSMRYTNNTFNLIFDYNYTEFKKDMVKLHVKLYKKHQQNQKNSLIYSFVIDPEDPNGTNNFKVITQPIIVKNDNKQLDQNESNCFLEFDLRVYHVDYQFESSDDESIEYPTVISI